MTLTRRPSPFGVLVTLRQAVNGTGVRSVLRPLNGIREA